MKDYDYILFDLDGTLTDPAMGITNSVIYALQKFGILVEDRSALYPFIGPPLGDSFEAYYGFSKEQSQKAVAYYREYFSDKGLYENHVYPGIAHLLQELVSRGKRLVMATSKPTVFARRILEHFSLCAYFSYVSGSNLDGTRVKKDEVIAHAMEHCQIADVSRAVMIGDRKHDILGAKKMGMQSIGVLYGYGDRNELEQAGADDIAETVDDIVRLLL